MCNTCESDRQTKFIILFVILILAIAAVYEGYSIIMVGVVSLAAIYIVAGFGSEHMHAEAPIMSTFNYYPRMDIVREDEDIYVNAETNKESADKQLTKRQIIRGDINKKAIDGAVMSTVDKFAPIFADELNEAESAEWWGSD
jgi:hypothetical protein